MHYLYYQAACHPLSIPLSGDNLIKGAVKAMNVYFNYTGTTPCFDLGNDGTSDLGIIGWGYQV